MSLTQTQVSQLYVSLFGRASEGEGNTFWQATTDTATAANNMLATTAASTYFGTSLNSDQAFVEFIYLNTLNKTATDDAAGITFWVDALANGATRGEVVASLINSAATIQAEIKAGSTAYNAATVAAAQQFENRVTVSDYTATTLQTAPTDYATSLAFNSASKPAGALTVTSVATTVTTANVTVANAAHDAAVAHVTEVQNNPAATIADLNAANAAVTTTAAAVVTAQETNTAALATEAAAAAAAAEAADVAAYDAALVTYNTAVTTAAASKAAADTAATDVSTLALATASKTAATTANTDATAVVTAATALVAKAAATDATTDDTTAAADKTAADTAATAAATALATANTAVNNLTAQTFTIAAASAGVTEGNAITFTVTADHARNVDTTVNYQIQGVTTSAAAAATPLSDVGVLDGTITILAGATTGTITLTPSSDNSTEGYEAFKVVLLDADLNAGASSQNVVISDAPNSGQAFSLTTGVDDAAHFTGGAGNDTYTAVIAKDAAGAATTSETFTALDYIDGGNGTDVLNLNNISDITKDKTDLSIATIKNIETINIQSANNISSADTSKTAVTDNVDFSNLVGLTTLNATKSAAALVKAAATTDVNVSGASDLISVVGGKNVVVNDATTAKAITVGDGAAAGDAAGTITITDTNNGGAAVTDNVITTEGGTDVTITTTTDGTKATSGNITVGSAANGMATGAVVVTQNTNVTSDTVQAGSITVVGGSTITVNTNSTNIASLGDSAGNVTAGAITVTGGNTTTAVNITQTNSATDYASVTTGGVTEQASVKFGALKSGDKVTLSVNNDATADTTELTFTAAKDLTASEVATAFANLTNLDTQAAGGKVANGFFTGALSLWTSATASTDTVIFTSTTANTNMTDLQVVLTNTSTHSAAAVVTTTDGVPVTSTTAVDVTAATAGAVTINDNATAAITDVTVNGYGAMVIGTTTALTKLANLSLANSAGTATVDADAGITSLNLTVNKVNNAIDISTNSTTVATLNVTATGADSTFALAAAQVKDLNVAGSQSLNLTGSTLTALEKVVVTGTAGLDLGAVVAAKSITTTGTTGAVTATIDGTAATYTGGAGVDTVTLATGTALTKAIDLGAGNDTVVFSATVTGSSAALSGGADTDTLSMTTTNADSLDASAQTFYTSFERLTLNDAYGNDDANTDTLTVNLANLGLTSYVTTAGTLQNATNTANNDILVLDKLAANATVALTAKGLITAALADATAGTDIINVQANVSTTDIDFGTFTVASVETINLVANDTNVDENSDLITYESGDRDTSTLALVADTATTLNITGNANVTLGTLTDAAKLATIDGSAMSGSLSLTSANTTTAVTIKGGSAADTIVAASTTTFANTIYGYDGNDAITAGAGMDKLYGGNGADTFNITVASVNVNSAATIMDATSGDVIKFSGTAAAFKSAAVSLDTTAVFQDYANAAINAIAANEMGWFQYAGNTYVVKDITESTTFDNGTDMIVKITGTVDLSTASYNQTNGTLEIA